MSIALATVAGLIHIYTFPFGGSVTLFSMLFIVLPAYFFGVPYGIISGLIYGLIIFGLEPYYVKFTQFLFDYIFAFSVMGLAGIVRNSSNGLLKGYILAIVLRWIMASIAGMIWVSLGMTAWDGWSPLPYSMAYNAAYIFAEGTATVLVLFIPAVSNAIEYVKTNLCLEKKRP